MIQREREAEERVGERGTKERTPEKMTHHKYLGDNKERFSMRARDTSKAARDESGRRIREKEKKVGES